MRLFDAHLHIIEDGFPLQPNQGFVPGPFSCDDYLQRMRAYELLGGVIVSGSFQAFDQTYLLHALDRLGATFIGVTQLPASVSDTELLALDRAGVRAVRFNLRRGGSESLPQLDRLARRVHERVGWHIEIYCDAAALDTLYDTVIALPSVSIDHLGLSRSNLGTVLKLAEQGVRIKASGFARVDLDIGQALRDIAGVNPGALMFGSDLPGTRAPRPFRHEDVELILQTLDTDQAENVLYRNAMHFYRLSQPL